jgi:branched-chain amino acid transport system permease protein
MEHIVLNILLWVGLYLIVCTSLNIEYGFGGIPNFGRAFAVLVGAFAVGGIVNRILMLILGVRGGIVEGSGVVKSVANEIISQNPAVGILILILALCLAAVLGALSGALFILPSARLSDYYLAITLLAISEVMFMVGYYNPAIIGGYYGVSTPDLIAFIPGEHRLAVFSLMTLAIALFIHLLVCRMLNTPYGRLLRAMRENESVVEACGKNVMTLRIKTCAVGSAIAAIAGALYSLYATNVIASSFNRVEWTFYAFLMIILGGLGNNRGVVAGVLSFVLVKVLLTVYKWEITEILHLPFEAVWLEYIFFGVLMLLVLMYKPEGLIKEKPIMTGPIKSKVEKKFSDETT